MTMMFDVKITSKGSGLVMDNPLTVKSAMPTDTFNNRVKANPQFPRDLADTLLYKDRSGNSCIPNGMMYGCFTTALKAYRRSSDRNMSIHGMVTILEKDILILSEAGMELFTRSVPLQKAGSGRVVACNPIYHNWSAEFTIMVDEEALKIDELREVLNLAGKQFGLGAYRKGGFGRFWVSKFQEVKDDLIRSKDPKPKAA